MYKSPYKTRVKRERITVKGIVQGVGFRPFVFNLARSLNLTGYVTNRREGVIIEVEGGEIDSFVNSLLKNAPPLSEIDSLHREEIEPKNSDSFDIVRSESKTGNRTLISPDVSICSDCERELFDKANRRFLYPFVNCTNCGPRFTIIEKIPYDRPFTTMKNFEMCTECRNEYENPADRRFHAQPNACAVCGPKVWIECDEKRIEGATEVFEFAAEELRAGKLGAIKGLGGFHLACLATDENAVSILRNRKNRRSKPFAVMLPDLHFVRSVASVNEEEAELLNSKEKPILLLKSKHILPENIAPESNKIGVMLPYTPLHFVLFYFLKNVLKKDEIPALVMTSANISEEPICISNDDAKERLKNIADFFLFHNRDILIRTDDSVGVVVNGNFRMIRRSRGFTPKRVKLFKNPYDILAVGAELKNTICVAKNENAFLSQHIGDLTNLRAHNFFLESVEHMRKIMDCNPEYVVCDMHPNYQSTKFAESLPLKAIKVQHHHAHMASCMLENRVEGNVVGVVLDGTGFGYDSTIWGGEILYGNYTEVERVFHLRKMPLPGGDSAVKEPWRTAVAYAYIAAGAQSIPQHLRKRKCDIIMRMIDSGVNSPFTSSAGRLFDAAAALAGGPPEIDYEAEAAIHFMNAAKECRTEETYNFDFLTNGEIDFLPLIIGILNDVRKGIEYSEIAVKFHNTLIVLFSRAAMKAADMKGSSKIILSGGVFQNEILLNGIENRLNRKGYEVYSHKSIPSNDGGVSLGQTAIAAALLNENNSEVTFIK